MADSIANIEAQVDAQIALDNSLVDLNSTSNVALFKGLRSCFALVMNLFERQQDDYEAKLQAIVDNKNAFNNRWWEELMIAYQHGDLLLYVDHQYKYQPVDPTHQVISLCKASGSGGVALLKCATLVGGLPQPLSGDQLAGAQSYANEMRPCGIDPIVQSYPGDLLKLFLNIYYNPQGDLPAIKSLVEASIITYITTLDFNGVFYINNLIDAIQAIPAIIDDQVVVVQAAAKPNTGGYADIVSSYRPLAGYFVIDPDFPLSATLTYIVAP
jgi:hypothetical protein